MSPWNIEKAALAALALSLLGGPAAAQRASSVEVGAFGRYEWLDKDLGMKDRAGIGGRVGVFLAQNVELEAEVPWVHTALETPLASGLSKVDHYPVRLRLNYGIPAGNNVAVLLGAGYVSDLYRAATRITQKGGTGLAGLRIGPPRGFSARIEGTVDYIPSPDFGTSNVNWGIQAGLSYIFARAAPKPAPVAATAPVVAAPPPDDDHDGVIDANDACPNTPAGEAVDSRGCSASQRDADKDGVSDAGDACPNTPAGEAVDSRGCSASQRDGDKDGVNDARDTCPNTPAGEAVDEHGCSASQRDSDGDGVPDSIDKCPNTLGGATVDETGCTPLFKAGTTTLVLEGVYFETGKAVLTLNSQQILDKVGYSLIERPDVRVEIAGYTDNTGAKATNVRLSNARAKAVRDYLISRGVNPDNVTAKGYGPENPVAPNTTKEGRGLNRRVELHKLP